MDRRNFIRGMIAAPAIVAIGNLMPIRGIVMDAWPLKELGQTLIITGYDEYGRQLNERFALSFKLTKEAMAANLTNGIRSRPWQYISQITVETNA